MSGLLLDLAQHRHAVDVGQLVVEQHQVDAVGDAIERLLAGRRLDDLVAVGAQPLGERPANQLFVVDDEDGGVSHHAAPVSSHGPRCRPAPGGEDPRPAAVPRASFICHALWPSHLPQPPSGMRLAPRTP